MTIASLLTWCRRGAGLLCAAGLRASCGGSGVDSGGTGAPVATSLAAGPVTGLGSVILDGVRFGDAAATIADADGNTLTVDQLQPGMGLRIDATTIDTSAGVSTSTALAIRVNSEIVGPVDSVDTVNQTLVVLGQAVRLTVATWFDSALSGGLAQVSPGQVVEVFGNFNARTGNYVATRIATHPTPAAYVLRPPRWRRSMQTRTRSRWAACPWTSARSPRPICLSSRWAGSFASNWP